MSMYTLDKVYRPLADKLPQASPDTGDIVRWSIVGGSGGIAAQRAAHFNIYGADPAIAKIRAFPDAAWDPTQPDVGAKFGITWVLMSDLHHNAAGEEPIAAVVSVDNVVLVVITLSATIKHIQREDGEDENGVTRLVMALLNHYPSLRQIRWADDVTRAGRDRADWTQITMKCKHRDVVMVFGGQRYDQRDSGSELSLAALGMVGGNDDPNRRRKLTGKRLLKYKLGGAAIAELQMPHGWHHQKDAHGRAVTEGEKGLVPEADPAMVPVLQALFRAHAANENYQDIAARMIAFEEEGRLRRRDHTDLDNTYARAADDPQALYDAAKSFFVRSSFRPRVAPSAEDIARYVAGEDPVDVFDADARLYITKVELVRSGRYFRRLTNDIRGRSIVLDGVPAIYRDERDEYGWFDVLSEPWAWPLGKKGRPVPRFGVSDETCRKVAARLLRELREPKAPTGGQAHRSPTRRALQAFDNWTVAAGKPGSRYDDEPTEWGVEARQNNSGKANFILLFRRQSAGTGPRGRRAWSFVGAGESRPGHIAATASLAELSASVAVKLDQAVRTLLDPTSLVSLAETQPRTDTVDPTASWRHQIDQKRAEVENLEKEGKGHRTMAALAASAGDQDEALEYAGQASETRTRIRDLGAAIARLEAKIRDHAAEHAKPADRDDQGDVSIAAYLVAGLERAARSNGMGPARVGLECDETFTEWRFWPDDEDLVWSCVALLPLVGGGHARLPLTGTIRNVRTRTGKKLATTSTVVRYLFEEGRSLDDVASTLEVTRKTLLTQRVMPWLVSTGITSRGAKCALVDHPLQQVRRELYQWTQPRDADDLARLSMYDLQLRRALHRPGPDVGRRCRA